MKCLFCCIQGDDGFVLTRQQIFKGHYDQIQMHLEGLRRVVTLRGSLGDFAWPVVCQIKMLLSQIYPRARNHL